MERSRGVEGFKEGVVAYIADENSAAGGEHSKRPLEYPPEVRGAREILHHRIQHYEIKMPDRQPREVLRCPR